MLRFIIAFAASAVGLVLVLPALILMLPLWGISALVRVLAKCLEQRNTPWPEIIEFEPEIGWKQRPNLNARYADKNGDSCSVQTDSEGWPGQHPIQESDVLVFGDSFAFGYGVNKSDAYFSQAHSCRIKPIGSPGYNMVQALLWMRRYADRLRGKTVVWFICTENDLAENLKPFTSDWYPTPFLRRGNEGSRWEVVGDHVQPQLWILPDAGISNVTLFAHLCTPCPYSARVHAAARYLIHEACSLCQTYGARLVLFSIPYKRQLASDSLCELRARVRDPETFDPDYPDKQLSSICGELGISFIGGTAHLTLADYKERDGHWNLQGNRKVAGIIEDMQKEARG